MSVALAGHRTTAWFYPALAVICLLLSSRAKSQTNSTSKSPVANSTQMLLVSTKDWNSVSARMRRFARPNPQSPWAEIGTVEPVVVGRNGLGWGLGLNAPAQRPGPVKHEGDGKSPAGVFHLSSAFGLAAPEEMKSVKLPYRQLTSAIECVDDTASSRYNSIVDRKQIARPDWNSSEKMRDVGAPYRLGVVVDHNTSPTEPGGGSCIFLHIWKSPTIGTSGCTAMPAEKLEEIVRWLDPAAHPVLVQLPEGELLQLNKSWHLGLSPL